jgi:quinolinate synthase
MAGMITAGELRTVKMQHPGAAVVCYVNSTAEVKAESDICCTSSNAVAVVRSLKEDRVIFVPDRNLALYAARFTDKEILPWEGYCIVHDRITAGDVRKARELHPRARVIVHPECRPEVIDAADHVASTSGIISEVCTSKEREFIIGTEIGILHRLEKECPEKVCHPLLESMVCTNMKKTRLVMVRDALSELSPRVSVPPGIADGARRAIERMLSV